jgi:hypothetical protein
LSVVKLRISVFYHLDAFLLSLSELVLELHHLSGSTRHFEVVQIDKVTEPEHLFFVVFTLSDLTNLLIFLNDLLHRLVVGLVSVKSLSEALLLLVKFSLSVD